MDTEVNAPLYQQVGLLKTQIRLQKLVQLLVQLKVGVAEIRANEGTRTPEWWNHKPLP